MIFMFSSFLEWGSQILNTAQHGDRVAGHRDCEGGRTPLAPTRPVKFQTLPADVRTLGVDTSQSFQ